MARELVVRIVGDADQLARELKRADRGVQSFGSRMSRNLGRAGIAAGAALGVGAVVGLKKSIDAAMEAQAVLGQTQVALKNVGASWATYGKQIQDTTTRLSRLAAVNDEELLQSFQVLLRGTGNVNEALRLNAVAADLARARNMDVASAAQLLVKAYGGQIGGLRRLLPWIDKNATAQEALAAITKRFAGAAEAYGKSAAGAQDRFRIAVEELQEQIGSALLPTVTRYLSKATKWLENTENQKRITDAVKRAVTTLTGALKKLQAIVTTVTDALGGWRNTIATVIGAWFGLQVAATTSATRILFANVAAARGVAAAWKAALISTGWGALAVASGVAASYIITHWENVKTWFFQFWYWLQSIAVRTFRQIVEPFSKLPGFLGQWARDIEDANNFALAKLESDFANAGERSGTAFSKGVVTGMTEAAPAATDETAGAGGGGAGRKGPSAADRADRRNQWFDAMINRQLGRVQDITSLKGQFARLHEIAVMIRARYAVTKDITRRLALEDQLLNVYRQQRGINAQLSAKFAQDAADAKEAAAAAKEHAKAMREAAASRREAAQFTALGFTGEGLARIPGAKALRGAAERLGAALKGTVLDTRANRGMLGRIRDVLSGRLGEVSRAMRERVQQMIQDLQRQLGDLPKKTKKGGGRRRGRFDAEGNLIGVGQVGIPSERHVPSIINRFTGAVEKATEALTGLEKLSIFADLKQFGGNLWSRAGTAALGGRMTSPGNMGMPRIQRGSGQTGMPAIFGGGGGRHTMGGGTVVVNQHFNAPTTDRHREARYAMIATRAVFDS